MPIVNVGGQPVFYEDTGGDGPPVLFCHGFLMDHTMFDPQVEVLAPEYRCVRMDERGFGHTPVDGPFTYWDLADDAVGVLDHLGLQSAFLVGMSQGGYLSLRAALRHPERVEGLVLLDTEAGVDDEETRAGYREMFDTWMEHGPVDELLEQLAGMILGDEPTLREEWMERWRAIPRGQLRWPVECLLGREDITGRLAEISCPALVIRGEEDPAISEAKARQLVEGIPGTEGFVQVPGAAHAPNLSHPEAVNPPVREFLDRHSS